MNGGARDPLAKRPPTDLELMLYADGELEGERLREVKLAIEKDAALRSKLTALRLASEIVRDDALAAEVDLTDGIMARIASAPDTAERDPRDAAPRPKVQEERPPAKVEPLLQPGVGKVAAKGSASNDNARGIFALTAVAVAAAAAMMIWGRMDSAPTRPQNAPVAVAPNTQEAAPEPPAPVPPAAAPAQESETDMGVEVAAVDFGSRIGTIFYVPTEAAPSNHTTTVVWLADDPAGGEQ
ncbi:hypothetical protein E8A73_018155 [Polyangium aurulentum]|nr:hypothetical protein E8A73_018155 [Polyangium aurulentum]